MQKLICDEVVKSGILQSICMSTSKFLFYAPTHFLCIFLQTPFQLKL